MKDMKRLFGYMGPYKKDMILGALFVMIETGFELFIPIMISNLIDIGVANHDVNYIYVKGVQMALLALGALVTGLLYAHFSAKASYGWGAEIRKAEYARVQQYAFSNLDHFVTSSLITRMTTDVNVLQNMIISGFRPITRGPSLLIMGIGLSFYMNPKLAFVFVVCTPILAIILFLIVLVGAFGLVSTLVMTVTEKQSDIAILRTLGASPGAIMRIFMIQGSIVGFTGVAVGVSLGLLIACNLDVIVPFIEGILGVEFLPKEIYFISSMPSDPRASDIVPIAVLSFAMSLIATLYPSWRAARTRPAEALRYE